MLFSVLLRPPMEGDRVFVLTMVLALAGLKAVQRVAAVEGDDQVAERSLCGARKNSQVY